ncbi:MAG: methionyl-tRNA formyltransferase [Oligoflexia bacterium]|nr:methionyl-tRNA formyltransferase [Oligoflexia bacterium]
MKILTNRTRTHRKLNVIFCGTPDFCLPTLELLLNHPHINLSHIITPESKPVGRGRKITLPAVAQFAIDNNIPLFQTENINKEEKFLSDLNLISDEKNYEKDHERNRPDIILVLAFCQFLSQKILDLPRIGAFNIHASILPKLRGAAPIQHAILKGEKSSGISIQKMVKKMDAGDVVQKDEIEISESEIGGQLFTRLKFLAALSTNSFLQKILNNNLTFEKQDETKVTFAPCLQREYGHINFLKDDFETINKKVRALDPWPGTYCFLNGKRLKIFEIEPITMNVNLKPGEVKKDLGGLVVGVMPSNKSESEIKSKSESKIKAVRLSKIQLEGKKCCCDVELLHGLREEITLT